MRKSNKTVFIEMSGEWPQPLMLISVVIILFDLVAVVCYCFLSPYILSAREKKVKEIVWLPLPEHLDKFIGRISSLHLIPHTGLHIHEKKNQLENNRCMFYRNEISKKRVSPSRIVRYLKSLQI